MRAEDLMIGDWVKFPIGNERIIDLPYIMGKGICASFAASATLFPVEVEKLEPTPLTPEILEKNLSKHRFSDSDFTEYEEWYSDDKRIRVIKDSRGYFAKVEDEELLSTLAMGTANFVHEWQHILNHGKIGKEIVL